MNIERHVTGSEFEQEFGYARAVRAGPFLLVSGTTPTPDALERDFHGQFISAASRVEQSLAALGGTLANVVRTVVYVRDLSEIHEIASAHASVFGQHPPASTVVEVSRLAPHAALVEIEATAFISG